MIAIIGGGVAGASVARALAVRGHRDVTVFDPLLPGGGSTGRAFGGFRTQFASMLNIELSMISRQFFLDRAEQIQFRCPGYLVLASDSTTAAELTDRAGVQTLAGLPIQHPDPGELVPFLRKDAITAANFCDLDGTYDPMSLLQLVVEEAKDAGAEFRYGSEVSVADLDGATVVVAAGVWSSSIARDLGIELPVEPVDVSSSRLGPLLTSRRPSL